MDMPLREWKKGKVVRNLLGEKKKCGEKVAAMEQSISLSNDCHLSSQSCTRIRSIVA